MFLKTSRNGTMWEYASVLPSPLPFFALCHPLIAQRIYWCCCCGKFRKSTSHASCVSSSSTLGQRWGGLRYFDFQRCCRDYTLPNGTSGHGAPEVTTLLFHIIHQPRSSPPIVCQLRANALSGDVSVCFFQHHPISDELISA